MSLKNPVTLAEIDPGSVRLVAQRLGYPRPLTDIRSHYNQVPVLTPHLRVMLQYYKTYTKATEGSPMDRGDDEPRDFPLSTISFLSFPSGLDQEAKSFFGHRGLLHGQRMKHLSEGNC
jgi:hypothetical protein